MFGKEQCKEVVRMTRMMAKTQFDMLMLKAMPYFSPENTADNMAVFHQSTSSQRPLISLITKSASCKVQSSVLPKDPIAAPQRRGSSEASVLTRASDRRTRLSLTQYPRPRAVAQRAVVETVAFDE
jgi:hypothetical protein